MDPDGYTYGLNVRKNNDWIYWKCHTHCDVGCRATATTKGFVLEKLQGDHTHLFEKVRMNKRVVSKDPNIRDDFSNLKVNTKLTDREIENGGKIFNVEANYVTSQMGHPNLIDPDANVYEKNSHRQNGHVVYWRCKFYPTSKCPGRAVTVGRILEKLSHGHTTHFKPDRKATLTYQDGRKRHQYTGKYKGINKKSSKIDTDL